MGEKRKKEEEAAEHERQRAAAEEVERKQLEKRKEAEQRRKERLDNLEFTKITKDIIVPISTVVTSSNSKSDAFIKDIPPLTSSSEATPESYIKLLDSVKEVVPVCESKPN